MTRSAPVAAAEGADCWSAVLSSDGSVTVEPAGWGEIPARVLGLSHDGSGWACDSEATQRVLDAVLTRGVTSTATRVYDDPTFGVRTFEFTFGPLEIGGARLGVNVRCDEVTGRQALMHSARTQARLLESVVEGVLLIDANGYVLTANPAAAALLGRDCAALIGSELAAVAPRLADCVRVRDTGDDVCFERIRDAAAGASVACTVHPLNDERGTRMLVLRDVTSTARQDDDVASAVRRERERIARDLHDGVGQELTAVALLLRGVSAGLRHGRADTSAQLDRVVQLVNGVIGGARSIAHGLFEVPVPERDLVTALDELARSCDTRHGPRVTFVSALDAVPELDPKVGIELLRIAQEATANALRHSGARRIDVRLLAEPDAIRLVVEDDGRGMDTESAPSAGMGIGIMRFRAHTIGSELEIGRRDGGGTRVACRAVLGGG